MPTISTADLKKTAKELNELMGLSPEIDTKADAKSLSNSILEAASMLAEGETVSKAAAAVISALKKTKKTEAESEDAEAEPEEADAEVAPKKAAVKEKQKNVSEEEEASPEEDEEPLPVKKTASKEKKADKPVKEKKAKNLVGTSRYGHRLGTQSAKIDDALWNEGEGNTAAGIAKATSLPMSRVGLHIAHLEKNGLVINRKGDVFIPVKKSLSE